MKTPKMHEKFNSFYAKLKLMKFEYFSEFKFKFYKSQN